MVLYWTELPNEKLRKIGPGVYELGSNFQTNLTNSLYILINKYTLHNLKGYSFEVRLNEA